MDPALSLQLWSNLLIKNSIKHKNDEEFNHCQWDATDQATLTTITATYEEYKESLIDVIGYFNKAFLYCQAKNYQFFIQDEIQILHSRKEYCKLHLLVVYNLGQDGSLHHEWLCFILNDSNHYTSFLYQAQAMLVDYLKANHQHLKNLIYFSDGCGGH